MDYVWRRQPVTAEAVREGLAAKRPMKDSTVRTVLRRLEEKGYVTHGVEGRTYVYQAHLARTRVAARAVHSIVQRFCDGSLEELLVGMVEADVLDRKELEELARKIARAKERKS
jgi:BlaI family transcriptional regulator, penicillinase repressor